MSDALPTSVSSILDGTAYQTATKTDTSSSGEISKDEFLMLLVTQLRYQDPLNPTESAAFAADLAQFTQVEQLENVNDNLKAGLEGDTMLTQSLSNTLAATLIGKEVRALGNTVLHEKGEQDTLNMTLQSDADTVKITVKNSSGITVDEFTESGLSSGTNDIVWDGTDASGTEVESGKYYYEVSAADADGNTISVNPFMTGKCSGVRYLSGSPYLVVNGLEIPLSDVAEILESNSE